MLIKELTTQNHQSFKYLKQEGGARFHEGGDDIIDVQSIKLVLKLITINYRKALKLQIVEAGGAPFQEGGDDIKSSHKLSVCHVLCEQLAY